MGEGGRRVLPKRVTSMQGMCRTCCTFRAASLSLHCHMPPSPTLYVPSPCALSLSLSCLSLSLPASGPISPVTSALWGGHCPPLQHIPFLLSTYLTLLPTSPHPQLRPLTISLVCIFQLQPLSPSTYMFMGGSIRLEKEQKPVSFFVNSSLPPQPPTDDSP